MTANVDKIVNAITNEMTRNPGFTEDFAQNPRRAIESLGETKGVVLSAKEGEELQEKLKELPGIKSKGASWLGFNWWF